MTRKHAQTPLHKMWNRRVEGQIRSAMKDHPDWFTGMPERGIQSMAKRIVGEIVAVVREGGDDRECSGSTLGPSRGDDVLFAGASSAEGSGTYDCSLPHTEPAPTTS